MSRYGYECESRELSVQSPPMWKALIVLLLLGVGAAALWVNAGSAEGPAIEIGGPALIGQTGEVAVQVTTPGGELTGLTVTLVHPKLVVEVSVDVARDASGRWRHPARLHRVRWPSTRRVVRPGGVLAATVKRGDGDGWSDRKLDEPRWFTYWTEDALAAVVTAAGWRGVTVRETTRPGADERWLTVTAHRPEED